MDGNKVVNAQNLAELAKKIKESAGPEQHLYWHGVYLFDYGSTNKPDIHCCVLSTDPTPFTVDTFFQFCYDIYNDNNAHAVIAPVSGTYFYNSSDGHLEVHAMWSGTLNTLIIQGNKPQAISSESETVNYAKRSNSAIRDTVDQIF